MTSKTVGVLTRNLMDRSKLEAGLAAGGWEVAPLRGKVVPHGIDALVVDLEHPAAFEVIEALSAKVICLSYGPHVDTEAFERASRAGSQHTLPRSILFRDVTAQALRLDKDRTR